MGTADNTDDDFEVEYEEHSYFIGCTCKHEPEEHTWGECMAEDCECLGGWEE